MGVYSTGGAVGGLPASETNRSLSIASRVMFETRHPRGWETKVVASRAVPGLYELIYQHAEGGYWEGYKWRAARVGEYETRAQ